jgi:hypothetical protein
VHKNADVVLRYPKLDKESLRLRVYADASFASNRDETSQLGFVIFLADKHEQCQPDGVDLLQGKTSNKIGAWS